MSLDDITRDLNPEESILLLGAGASVPSGGRTGIGLAQHLCQVVAGGEIESDDLAEACSLLEDGYDRPTVVKALAADLQSLEPDSGLLSLMSLDWARAYTTNYDQLVERACKKVEKPLEVIRTNFDFARLDKGGFELLKIHGCITRDRAFGHSDSMILTERDYDEYSRYREGLFARLQFDLHTKNVVIIGQSLKDKHLRDLVDRVASTAKEQGTANKIRILVYSSDRGRMRLFQERNLLVGAGTVSQFVDALALRLPVPASRRGAATPSGLLPRSLLTRTVDIDSALQTQPDAVRLFGGGSASYADIAAGLTFERTFEQDLAEHLSLDKIQFASLVGSAGVGKTTAGRRLIVELRNRGFRVYEHVGEFQLEWKPWLQVAQSAQAAGHRVALFVDDAFKHLTGINRLANHLADDDIRAMTIVLAAHGASWDQRSKTGVLRRLGREERFGQLDEGEISRLVNLIRSQNSIRSLLDASVVGMGRSEQIRVVREKSRADMFVALKYLFATEALDEIILTEFAELADDVQEVYRVASLLEASYAHASRQMILEVLDLNWSDIPTILERTRGVLSQKEVDRRNGVFTWRTRHPVIAQIIARYKYHDQDELYYILKRIVENLNSAMLLDRDIVPNLCDTDWGIGRLVDLDRQVALLEMLCLRSNNRVPWHRLISIWIDRDLVRAESTIRQAISAVGTDSPIARYEVRLKLRKATRLRRLGTDDDIALIFEAEAMARDALERWPDNKYTYRTLMEVGEALHEATGNSRLLEEAVVEMGVAYDEILDDQLLRWRQRAASLIGS